MDNSLKDTKIEICDCCGQETREAFLCHDASKGEELLICPDCYQEQDFNHNIY